ncbi:MAG: NUDIX domain-containing protein [Chloroflexota bacterium]|nr:NUDIX domain-containing protein [Chloroflexota bacterium]
MELVERPIVACILRHGDKIALLKRSQSVASSPGRWHCVTGFIDAGVAPLEQALIEIAEETGLAGDALSLAAAPPPIRVERPHQGWVWVIYPFLFDAASPELRLDWEHDEYRWIDPAELPNTDCVTWVETVWEAISGT